MKPFQVRPEIVGPGPFLLLVATAWDRTSVVLAIGNMLRVATSLVSVNIVRCAEALRAGTARDIAIVRLLVFLLVFP